MPTIDPKFIDVDFEKDKRYVRGDLGIRAFDVQRFASFEDVSDIIPESQWKSEADATQQAGGGCSQLVTRIYNQKSEGSCVANACSQSIEVVQARQFGRANVIHLSAISLYKRIGRSPGSGAMVSDGMEEICEKGVLPLDTPENRAKFGDAVMPNTGFYEKYPSGWEATAKKFRVTEWVVIRSVNALITALLKQWPVVVGRSGHSICYCDVVYRGGDLLVGYVNSWGNWGSGLGGHTTGFGFDSMGKIRSSAGWAFAPRSVVVN